MTSVANDSRARFAAAYEQLRPSLVRVAYLIVSDAQEASDLVQDVFEVALPRWAEIDDPATHLQRAVTARAYDVTRNRSRRAVAQARAGRERRPEVPDHEYLGDLIDRLPAKQRATVVLRFYVGLSHAEIAAALAMREGSVGPTLQRALRKLEKDVRR